MKRLSAHYLLALFASISCNTPSNKNQVKEPIVEKTDSFAEQKNINGQESDSFLDFNNPPWDTGCDSLTTQLEMNMCSGEKYYIADSILNRYYDTLIAYLNIEYQEHFNEWKTSHSRYWKATAEQIKLQRDAVIKSRNDFNKLVVSTTAIIGHEYYLGSMRPMAENSYALNLTINQLKILVNLIEEIIPK